MLQKTYRILLQKLPPDIVLTHPLHVGVNKTFIEGIEKSKPSLDENGLVGAVMREYPVIFRPVDCYFVQLEMIESSVLLEENESCLFVTDDFLTNYNFVEGDACFFKTVVCHTLDKVVLGSKSEQSYSWFQDFKDLNRHNDLVVECRNKRFLCRQDDALLVDPSKHSSKVFSYGDYTTLDCQPFRQGLITLESSLMVVDIRELAATLVKRSQSSENEVIPIEKLALSLINYTNSNFLGIAVPKKNLTPFPALKQLFNFEVRVMSKFTELFYSEIFKLEEEIDILNTVFLPFGKKSLFKSASWVRLNLLEITKAKPMTPDEPPVRQEVVKKKPPKIFRLAQVCCFSNEKASSLYFPNDKTVYISPHLWFCLNNHPSRLMQPEVRVQIEFLDPDFKPPVAAEAHAVLIQSPDYDSKINTSSILMQYFSVPRYVCKGDILSATSKDEPDFHSKYQDDEHDKLRWPAVYFRITMIDKGDSPSGYVMSNQTTRLYQVGTKQSYIPVTMEAYYSSVPEHPIWNSIPEGLRKYIYHLQDLIYPFLKLQNERCHLSCNILFSGPPCCGKTTVVKALSRCLNLHFYQVNCHELISESSSAVEGRLKNKIDKGISYAPCILLLKNIHLIGKEREALGEDSRVIHTFSTFLKKVNSYGIAWPVVVIGTTTGEEKLSSQLYSAFLHSVQMSAPNEEERSLLLQDLLSVCEVGNDVSPRYFAQRTAGFVLGDLSALVNQAVRNAYIRIRSFVTKHKLSPKEEEDLVLSSVPVVRKDLIKALETLQSKFAENIGAPKIPNVKFDDIGGLAHVKEEILDTIQLPLEHPEILFSGLRRSGVLLYGPPGSGKTMLAKAVATECSLNFLSVKGPELINMYVGQSEENVRRIFSQARSAVPCIIFFDELDSLAPNRGRSGDSGGVMDRVVSQLLSELDGLNKKSEVFVIGATNRPDLIDPALLRPGRFDRLLYVGIPEDKKSKLNILKALTRKIPLSPDVNLEEIIDKCPEHLSGADFYSLCSNAVIQRVEKNVEMIEKGNKTMEQINSDVQTEDFISAMTTLVPSVSPQQFQQYKSIKSRIEK